MEAVALNCGLSRTCFPRLCVEHRLKRRCGLGSPTCGLRLRHGGNAPTRAGSRQWWLTQPRAAASWRGEEGSPDVADIRDGDSKQPAGWRSLVAPAATTTVAVAAAALLAIAGPAWASDGPLAPECAALAPAQRVLGGADANTIVVVANVLELMALIGAGVGGWVAKERKDELEHLNAQLRQINLQLRKQARVETYAPALSYAPVGVGRGTREETIKVDHAPMREDLIKHLKAGKKCLREGNPQGALGEFNEALALSRRVRDTIEEKKAARGLGAAYQRLGKYKDAIGYHEAVLAMSLRSKERAGDTEAYGAIADCYTELGDLDKAAQYYDKYISRLEKQDDEE